MARRKLLDIGNSNFKDLIENNNYYVDKSLLIRDIYYSQKQVLLFPRPRRFGKTLNLLMLKYFFEIDHPENEKLFTNLKIWQAEKEVLERRGRHPIIYLSFKDAKANTWKDCFELLVSEVASLYESYYYLINSPFLSKREKNLYEKISNGEAKTTDYHRSIKQLSEYLHRYHKEKVVILVDEYDTPIHSGHKKYYEDVVSFMRNLLSGAFKDNLYLYKGIITGILRISKESIFTGLNNLSVYTIMENLMADKFGFTEKEVKQIVSDFDIPTEYDHIKQWYNGYTFGNLSDIYNPWSILNYVVEYESGFKPYWANTSSNEMLQERFKLKEETETRELIQKLISGETILKEIDVNFTFPDLDAKKDLLWTLLTFSGYLTTVRKLDDNYYMLKIPNYEVRLIFKHIILHWLSTEVKIFRTLLEDTSRYLVNNQLEKFQVGFKKIIGDTFSYFDMDGEPEKVYHSYTLGLLAILSDEYIIRSNRESGEGRYDILLIPHDKTKHGVIMEIKQLNKNKSETEDDLQERINTALKKALEQIETNEYHKELIAHKVEKIVKLPIVFVGKTAYFNKFL